MVRSLKHIQKKPNLFHFGNWGTLISTTVSWPQPHGSCTNVGTSIVFNYRIVIENDDNRKVVL